MVTKIAILLPGRGKSDINILLSVKEVMQKDRRKMLAHLCRSFQTKII